MLRPLRLEMGMLLPCATELFARLCATLSRYNATSCVRKKIWCDHCDLKWVCCDFVRPEFFESLRDFARLKIDMLRLRSTEEEHFNQVRPRTKHFDQVRPRKKVLSCDFALSKLAMKSFVRPIISMLRLCATQSSRFATLRDPKWICCDPN